MSTSVEMNLKTYHDLKEFLQKGNDACTAPPKPGAFSLFQFPAAPKNSHDLVFEGIYLGQASVALKLDMLKDLGVTHVLNASQGKKYNQTDTNADFYQEAGIGFHGVPALDIMTFKMTPHLRPAAQFLHEALQEKGVVYVHCQQGVSRSATLVLAYLMLHRHLSLMDAVRAVREKREVFPNDGFLKQLCMLEKEIRAGPAS